MFGRGSRWRADTAFLLACLAHALTAALTRVVGRDERRWLFGARFGEAYVDNARYLFEYADERPDVRAIWLSRDAETVAAVRARGFEAYHRRSLRGRWHALRAGVVVVTHGVRDVSLSLTGGAFVANCWHGLPLKTVGFDAELAERPWPVRRAHRFLAGRLDFVLSPSPVAVHEMATGLGVPHGRVRVAPYPRYDALVGGAGAASGDEATPKLPARIADRTVVFYLPTFRDVGADVADRVDVAALDGLLDGHDAHLVVKPHPYETLTLPEELDRVSALDEATDLTALLREADVLVTDYSSVFVDFLLLDRPQVFYAPDLDAYRAERGFYYDYETMVPGPVVRDDEGLRRALSEALTGDPAAERRRALRDALLVDPGDRPAERAFEVVRAALADRASDDATR
ncbi:CDP-glycerol glycerophosphotransferase family protein [Halomarina rubra]|uniref:CDP-glycerol glycerophosphotransferase family protein n=1 Tax=Halomarina rubra TaxID=2071873 RepID=A0ABD6AY07_9EURY|nr:CDP-glycerol glycerophosphotransferase family protein [Halomarina rubra]